MENVPMKQKSLQILENLHTKIKKDLKIPMNWF